MFLTRKKADKQTQDAVQDVLSRIPDLTPQVEALRQQVVDLQDELARVRADHFEREAALDSHLAKEREAAESRSQILMQAVDTVKQAMADYKPEIPAPQVVASEPDPRVADLMGWVAQQDGDLREINDTVQYLLESPPLVREIVTHQNAEIGVRAMYEQHSVRPMGVR